MIINIIIAISNCFYVYMLMIFVRCLLTWLPDLNWDNPILSALKASVDLYLDLFRKFIPPIGPFDFSPIVAVFVLIGIRNGFLYLASFLLQSAGAGQ